jgi:hypothetical protein
MVAIAVSHFGSSDSLLRHPTHPSQFDAVSSSFPKCNVSLEITAEGEVKVHAFAQAGGANLC